MVTFLHVDSIAKYFIIFLSFYSFFQCFQSHSQTFLSSLPIIRLLSLVLRGGERAVFIHLYNGGPVCNDVSLHIVEQYQRIEHNWQPFLQQLKYLGQVPFQVVLSHKEGKILIKEPFLMSEPRTINHLIYQCIFVLCFDQ